MWGDLLKEAARIAQGPSPAAAKPLIDRLLAQRHDDADALTLAGIVAQRTGETRTAIAMFSHARDVDVGNPARHQNLGVALKNDGQFDAACAAFETALRLRPGHPATLSNLGSCLISAGRCADALPILEQAGDHPDALTNMGVALAGLSRWQEATACYRQSLRLRPGHGDSMINLAGALANIGEHKEAETLLKAIAKGQPTHIRAANQLGLLLEKRGDYSLALAALRPALDLAAPHHALGVNLARILIRADEPKAAVDICNRLIATQPSITTPLALKMAALTRLGDTAGRDDLMGLKRFVTVHDIPSALGFADMQSFNHSLVEELTMHPSLTYEPAGLVTRKGRQSSELVGAPTPALSMLAKIATDKLAQEWARLARLPVDHPFLAAIPKEWTLTLWGTILSPGGEVSAHIHAPNWLSGVYYPAFAEEDDEEAGAFGIGMLPAELGGGGDVTVFPPRAGRMILFPSYLWHATLPFAGQQDRISFAFDLVPAEIGRPHHLH
ncbi:tetratricopeptide (TPR) repeat protein [Sphingobium xenophagum]|uniref:Tetratricopeptide (TPR) repeat protein n=1 Tax=Sphingobium xenophagum TaxID=121428 RepID=A0ABU1WY66_SPHXE|nr:tetratricopeptide repeat protein [Sphingobium xenophagum]MDR7154243.1 tetratricopeptide (TPR) repeat protein [Sphingobium xenophagum]